jgi:hypothetical protein
MGISWNIVYIYILCICIYICICIYFILWTPRFFFKTTKIGGFGGVFQALRVLRDIGNPLSRLSEKGICLSLLLSVHLLLRLALDQCMKCMKMYCIWVNYQISLDSIFLAIWGWFPLLIMMLSSICICVSEITMLLCIYTQSHTYYYYALLAWNVHYLLLAVQPFRHHPVLLLEGLENLCDFLRNTKGQRNSNPFLPGFLLGVAKNGHIN